MDNGIWLVSALVTNFSLFHVRACVRAAVATAGALYDLLISTPCNWFFPTHAKISPLTFYSMHHSVSGGN
jgi:hypothetical protein